MRPLPDEPVFTRDAARRGGWSDSALGRAVRSGRIVRVRHGHYATISDPLIAARAASLACRRSVVSHRSAALLYGLPLLNPPPTRPELTVPPAETGDLAAARLHRASLPPEHVMVVDGVPVTAPPRTIVDLGRTLGVGAAVVTADAALHRGLVDEEGLRAVLQRCAGWPGVRRARRTVAIADGASESPLESVSRLVIRYRLGLPPPRLQAVIRDPHGLVVARCDFYWDEFGVFGEADGRSKYDGRDVLHAEKMRHEDLENLGLVGVRWGWTDVRFRQETLNERIRRAFARGRLRDASGFPRNWSVDDG